MTNPNETEFFKKPRVGLHSEKPKRTQFDSTSSALNTEACSTVRCIATWEN